MAFLARSNADLLFSRAIFCRFDLLFGIWVSSDEKDTVGSRSFGDES